jgi:hypothetical protein
MTEAFTFRHTFSKPKLPFRYIIHECCIVVLNALMAAVPILHKLWCNSHFLSHFASFVLAEQPTLRATIDSVP